MITNVIVDITIFRDDLVPLFVHIAVVYIIHSCDVINNIEFSGRILPVLFSDGDVFVILLCCIRRNSAGNISISASQHCIPQWTIADIFSTAIRPRQHRRL